MKRTFILAALVMLAPFLVVGVWNGLYSLTTTVITDPEHRSFITAMMAFMAVGITYAAVTHDRIG